MRTLGLAYRDFEGTPDWAAEHEYMLNSNGTPALEVGTTTRR